MNIEEAIKQHKFDNEYHKLEVNLMYTSSWINGLHFQFFKQYGISPQQYNILRILRGQFPEPATINLLIDRMLDKTSNASRLVDKLCLKKYTTRTISDQDKRRVDVVITDVGLTLLKKIDSAIQTIYTNLSSISENEANQLNHLLDKLRS